MTDRMLELRDKVAEETCTVEELREYCLLAFPQRAGMWLQEADWFIQPDSMQAFMWLKDWWKLDEPPAHLKLNLLSMLWAIYLHVNEHGEPLAPVTLNSKILEFHGRAVAYCQETGRKPDDPGEDDEARRLRKQRDRMAHLRGTRRVPQSDIANEVVGLSVRSMEAQVKELKLKAKEADQQHRDIVIAYQQQMFDAAAVRKDVAQSYKDEIARIRSDIQQLITKQ